MTIFDIDPQELQNSNARHIKLEIETEVISIVYVNAEINMSQIWTCDIAFTTNQSANLIGQNAIITLKHHEQDEGLNLTGIIVTQQSLTSETITKLQIYLITVKMPLFLSNGNQHNRVFTEQNIDSIIKTILISSTMKINIILQANTQITACQFNETDLDFFHKICKHIGIFYFHNFDNNTLIVSDDLNMFNKKQYNEWPCKLQRQSLQLTFENTTLHSIEENKTHTNTSNATIASEYSVENENEIYTQRPCEQEHIQQIAKNLQSSRNQQQLSKYTILSTYIYPGVIIDTSPEELVHKFTFYCLPCKRQIDCVIYTYNKKTFILPQTQEKTQNKIFTGIVAQDDNQPSLETLNYVQVKLHFNCGDKNNYIKARISNTSCGQKYGTWHVPRGGQEVIIMFLDELLSYAIIIGGLYNDYMVPQYEPKKARNQSYWRGETIGKDGQKNTDTFFANEIFMDDTKKEELLRIGARLNCEFLVTKTLNMVVQEKTNLKLKTTKIELETLELNESKSTKIKSKTTDINVQDDYSLSTSNTQMKSTKDTKIESANTYIKANANIEMKCAIFKLNAQKIEIDSSAQIQIKCGNTTIEITPISLKIQAVMLDFKANIANIDWKIATINHSVCTIIAPTFTIQGGLNTIIGMTSLT